MLSAQYKLGVRLAEILSSVFVFLLFQLIFSSWEFLLLELYLLSLLLFEVLLLIDISLFFEESFSSVFSKIRDLTFTGFTLQLNCLPESGWWSRFRILRDISVLSKSFLLADLLLLILAPSLCTSCFLLTLTFSQLLLLWVCRLLPRDLLLLLGFLTAFSLFFCCLPRLQSNLFVSDNLFWRFFKLDHCLFLIECDLTILLNTSHICLTLLSLVWLREYNVEVRLLSPLSILETDLSAGFFFRGFNSRPLFFLGLRSFSNILDGW